MKPYFTNFDNKKIGIIISIISVITLFILASSSIKIAKIESARCTHPPGGQCPLTAHIPLSSYAEAALLIIVLILGVRVAFKSEAGEKIRKESAEKAEAVARVLKGDEKKAYELVMASQGAVFQSELVEKMGHSKVKVSRILDKLEGKNLIERRRRGLANMILIKYQ